MYGGSKAKRRGYRVQSPGQPHQQQSAPRGAEAQSSESKPAQSVSPAGEQRQPHRDQASGGDHHGYAEDLRAERQLLLPGGDAEQQDEFPEPVDGLCGAAHALSAPRVQERGGCAYGEDGVAGEPESLDGGGNCRE